MPKRLIHVFRANQFDRPTVSVYDALDSFEKKPTYDRRLLIATVAYKGKRYPLNRRGYLWTIFV